MPNYRRWRREGGMFFLTLVTHERRPIFRQALARRLLHSAMDGMRRRRSFELIAAVLLRDHLHMLWRLPEEDTDYSTRIAVMKKRFTETCLAGGGTEGTSSASRRKHRIRGVWEKRFYEHTIRGYRDYKRHLDYVHANPVKHGLVGMPKDWPYSTFHRYVGLGEYDEDWCGHIELPGGVDFEPDSW